MWGPWIVMLYPSRLCRRKLLQCPWFVPSTHVHAYNPCTYTGELVFDPFACVCDVWHKPFFWLFASILYVVSIFSANNTSTYIALALYQLIIIFGYLQVLLTLSHFVPSIVSIGPPDYISLQRANCVTYNISTNDRQANKTSIKATYSITNFNKGELFLGYIVWLELSHIVLTSMHHYMNISIVDYD